MSKISELTESTRYLFTDDVYIGILISQLTGVTKLEIHQLSAHELDLRRDSLIKSLYWRYYSRQTVFYHIPDPELFEMWWNCNEKESCYAPYVYTIPIALKEHKFAIAGIAILMFAMYRLRYRIMYFLSIVISYLRRSIARRR